MNTRDLLKITIIISYILLILCAVILFIGLWNKLSMNTDVQIGNGMYFLVLSMVVLASAIFIAHMLGEGRISLADPSDKDPVVEKMEEVHDPGTYVPPFEVDLDLLAEGIIPRIEHKEKIEDYAERILRNIAKHFEIAQGMFFLKDQNTMFFEAISTYAYTADDKPPSFKVGEGISGQVAKNKQLMHLTSIPEGYLQIQSGLGKSSPSNLLILPLLLNKETIGIIELASFHTFDKETIWTFRNLAKIIGNAMVTKVKAMDKK